MSEHVCTQKERIDDHEERLRQLEINQAVTTEMIKTMSGNISEIKDFLKDLPKMQAETQAPIWEKMMERVIQETKSNSNINDTKNITIEIIKVLGKALVIIGTLAGAIILILNIAKDVIK